MTSSEHDASAIHAGSTDVYQNLATQTHQSYSPRNHFIIKPPVRFRDISTMYRDQHGATKTDYADYEENDKVVAILQNILRKLENNIEHDRMCLKEERRKRQRERRRQREERREMTASRAALTRHEFSAVPTKPFSSREGINYTDRKVHVFKQDTGEIHKHDSFNYVDVLPKSPANGKPKSYLELGTRSLDRKRVKRSDSYTVSDWSRHSRDVITDADSDRLASDSNPEDLADANAPGAIAANRDSSVKARDKHISDKQCEEHRDGVGRVRAQGLGKCSSDNALSKSVDTQYTPTNIRRKLKSFEILPSLKRNGKETKKEKAIDNGAEDSVGKESVPVLGKVHHSMDDNPDVDKCLMDTSDDDGDNNDDGSDSGDDDDDLDIVFPSLRRKDKTFEREVKFSIGKEPEETIAIKGHASSSQKVLHESLGGTGVVRPSDRTVAMFRKKQKFLRSRNDVTGKRDTERPTSAGTSGYSTDECSYKATDSEDDCIQGEKENARIQGTRQAQNLKRYFLVLQHGINMALKVDNSSFQNGEHAEESCRPFLQNISMSDLAIPDHVGWLIDQSEHCKVWGVVVDMLFCVFEDEGAAKPRDVIILPGCNIRPLVYNTAINGLHGGKNSQTITGISKYQIVIDDSSSGRKHVYGLEAQGDLDTWHRILKKASALDPELTTDMSAMNDGETCKPITRPASFDGILSSVGYTPSLDSTRRSQRMRSPRDAYDKTDKTSSGNDVTSAATNGHDSHTNGNQSSPRSSSGLVRNDSRRQSISEFKKRLRHEAKPEVSKQLPVKATHFQQPTANGHSQSGQNGKKIRSFGSFESLLKFKRKKSKSSDDTASNEDGGSIVSAESIVSGSSTEQDNMTRSVDISASVSQLQKRKGKKLSRSLELSESKNGVSNGIVRRASDIKDRVFNRRPSKPFAKLGDLHDTSMRGFLLHKHHLKWQKIWCVVCRGCFYGFKSNSPDENAQIAVLLANCVVVFVSQQDKKQKRLYVFKLSQERSKSIYLCADDYRELMKWLTVLQMESNSVISNADRIRKSSESENDSICSSISSQSGSVLTVSSNEQSVGNEPSRSRSKKKQKAPAKPPRKFRNSSCPPVVSRESGSSTGEDTLTSGSISSSTSSASCTYGSSEDLPRYDKAVTHVWRNDRGYLFNAIRAKLSSYRRKEETIYNKDLPGAGNEGLMVVQYGAVRKVGYFHTAS